jgi:hypothetical protein
LPGPTASIVSSDFYYGFSPARRPGDYRHRLPALRRDFERLSTRVDLVDMEVGQFYALCRLIPDKPGLQFIAVKGASNAVENRAGTRGALCRLTRKNHQAGFTLPRPRRRFPPPASGG